MGMTIENSKKRLAIEKELAVKTGLNYDANGTLSDAIDVAIDTMCRYQKIEQIVKSKTTRLSYDVGFEQIKKVVEDGKID